MSFATAVDIFRRSFGRQVIVNDNAEGRNNGLTWRAGAPVGQINHHFGGSADPAKSQEQAAMLRDGYATGGGGRLPGPVVNTFLYSTGVLNLIATGPCNHAGAGSDDVVARIQSGQAPAGPAAALGLADDEFLNDVYTGTEVQNPGDGSGYPDAQIDALVDWNAALHIAFDWGDDGHRSIMHYESTARKPDMSWRGGVDGDGGPELRRRVAARIQQYRTGTIHTEGDLTVSDIKAISDSLATIVAQNQTLIQQNRDLRSMLEADRVKAEQTTGSLREAFATEVRGLRSDIQKLTAGGS